MSPYSAPDSHEEMQLQGAYREATWTEPCYRSPMMHQQQSRPSSGVHLENRPAGKQSSSHKHEYSDASLTTPPPRLNTGLHILNQNLLRRWTAQPWQASFVCLALLSWIAYASSRAISAEQAGPRTPYLSPAVCKRSGSTAQIRSASSPIICSLRAARATAAPSIQRRHAPPARDHFVSIVLPVGVCMAGLEGRSQLPVSGAACAQHRAWNNADEALRCSEALSS